LSRCWRAVTLVPQQMRPRRRPPVETAPRRRSHQLWSRPLRTPIRTPTTQSFPRSVLSSQMRRVMRWCWPTRSSADGCRPAPSAAVCRASILRGRSASYRHISTAAQRCSSLTRERTRAIRPHTSFALRVAVSPSLLIPHATTTQPEAGASALAIRSTSPPTTPRRRPGSRSLAIRGTSWANSELSNAATTDMTMVEGATVAPEKPTLGAVPPRLSKSVAPEPVARELVVGGGLSRR
jgi:hypothetical protein